MNRAFAGIAMLLTLWASTAAAAELQSFTAGSLAAIQKKYAGRPFILSMWSANWCGHCITELTMLGKAVKSNKQLPLVLVATDTPEFSAAIRQTQNRLGLATVDSWVFDDDIPERLRHAVDPAWHGELPRTYLYDAQHRREAVVGVLSEQKLKAWLKQHQ